MVRATSLWLTGIAGFALLLELLFRLLPVSSSTETGYYTDLMILTYPPHHRWISSTGWDLRNAQTLEANNLGYVAARDFERNPDAVALVGDSFVEAAMLAASDRPGAQLERALASRPVYAMGNPGTSLLDYAERIRFAHEQFGIRDFVVLMERGDVKQSLCGSGNINGPCLDSKTFTPGMETLPPPGTAKRILRYSALAQYLVGQLRLSPQSLWQRAFPPARSVNSEAGDAGSGNMRNGGVDTNADAIQVVDEVTKSFLTRIKPHVAGQLVIVIDSARKALYQGKVESDPARDRFIQLARTAGAIVIDTEPLYRAQLARSPLKLEVGPYDGHLNALGVKIAMQAAAGVLRK